MLLDEVKSREKEIVATKREKKKLLKEAMSAVLKDPTDLSLGVKLVQAAHLATTGNIGAIALSLGDAEVQEAIKEAYDDFFVC